MAYYSSDLGGKGSLRDEAPVRDKVYIEIIVLVHIGLLIRY